MLLSRKIVFVCLLGYQYISLVSSSSSFVTRPVDTVAAEGATVTLYCEFRDLPNGYHVEWFHRHKDYPPNMIEVSSNRTIAFPNIYPTYKITGSDLAYNLHITNLEDKDFAEFECKESTITGLGQRVSILKPVAPSTPVISGGDNVIEGETAVLTCSSTGGVEAPVTKWYTGANEITGDNVNETPNANWKETPGNPSTSVLRIQVSQSDHGKAYQCKVSNTATSPGDKSSQVTLNVKYGPKSVTVGPYATYKVIQGKSATLTCNADGNPAPETYQWRKVGSSTVVHSGQNYPISDVQLSHDASYTCTALNGIGNGKTSSSLKLDVLYPPGITLQDRYTYLERILPQTIKCTATGNPQPYQYIWTKTGQQANPAGEDLIISNRNDYGTYTCSATNRMEPSEGDPEEKSADKSTTVDVQYPPGTPSADPGEVTVNTGDQADLRCSLPESEEGNPKVTQYKWKKGGQGLGNHGALYSRQNVKVEQDDDSYTCAPFNDIGTGQTASITLIVQAKPSFTSRPQGTVDVVNSNDSLSIMCQDQARPNSSYTWFLNNIELSNPTSDIYISTTSRTKDGKWTVTNSVLSWNTASLEARRGGSGSLRCKAENVVDSVEASFSINVQYGPYGTKLSRDGTITKTENETLGDIRCETTSNPNGTYLWTADTSLPVSSSDGVLSLGKLSRAHHGMYTCNASNFISYETKKFNLIVNFPSKVISFSSSPGSSVNESTRFVVTCNVESRPASDLVLYFESDLELKTAKNQHTIEYVTESATCRSMGTYTCEGDNRIGNRGADRHSISITVYCSPSDDDLNPSVTEQFAKTGETKSIVFNNIGYPKPSYIWYQIGSDGIRKNLSDHMTHRVNSTNSYTHQAELIINGVEASDFMEYVCVAQNERNTVEKMFKLRAKGKPNRPSTPIILPIKTAVSLYISWQPGFDNGPSQTFTVQYKKVQEDTWITYKDAIPDPPPQQYKINPLQNNTAYVFRVQATNDEGLSGFTETSQQGTTKSLPKPGELQYSAKHEGGNVVVTVTSFPPDCTSVIIQCCETGGMGGCLKRDINDTSITPQIVKIKTEPGKTYTVSLLIYDNDDVIKTTEPTTAKRVQASPDSTATIIGVVVGVLLAVVVLLVIVFILWKRRQSRERDKDGTELNTRRSLIVEQGGGHSNDSFEGTNTYSEAPGDGGLNGTITSEEINSYAATQGNGSTNDINPYGELGEEINPYGVTPSNFSERPIDVDDNKNKKTNPDPAALYAEPDKSKKNKKPDETPNDIAAMYAQPDKVKKAKKNNKDDSVPLEALYAQPDKAKKKNKKQVEALYAEPDKTKKSNKDKNAEIIQLAQPADPIYAESDKKKKSKEKPTIAKKPAEKPGTNDKPGVKPKPTVSSKPATPTKPTVSHPYVNVQSTAAQPEGEYAEVRNPKKSIPTPSYENGGHMPDGENPYANSSSIPDGENPYANSGHIPAGDNPYQNWELPNTEPNPPPPPPDPDNPALLYADLSFTQNQNGGNQQSDVPVRQEEPTEYAAIDFKRTQKGVNV